MKRLTLLIGAVLFFVLMVFVGVGFTSCNFLEPSITVKECEKGIKEVTDVCLEGIKEVEKTCVEAIKEITK